jgi:uridine kinase
LRPKIVVVAGPIACGKTGFFRRIGRDSNVDEPESKVAPLLADR